jgi:hypothetical protein
MEKARDERFSEDHCHFSFDKSYLANILGCKPCRISKILGVFEGRNLLQLNTDEFIVKIYMPKLLEWLDRDTDRARPKRSQPELRNRRDKNKEIEEKSSQYHRPMQFYYEQADLFRAVASKCPPGDENLASFLGAQAFSWWCAIGSSRIRNMPSDEKGRKDLAYAIKQVAESSSEKSELNGYEAANHRLYEW